MPKYTLHIVSDGFCEYLFGGGLFASIRRDRRVYEIFWEFVML